MTESDGEDIPPPAGEPDMTYLIRGRLRDILLALLGFCILLMERLLEKLIENGMKKPEKEG